MILGVPVVVLLLSAWTFDRVQPPPAGLHIVPLTFSTASSTTEIREFPVASPDGRYVIFQLSKDPVAVGDESDFTDASNWDIYRVRTDGSELRRLTDDPALEDQAVWSPDSRTVVYRFAGRGSHDLWLMDADGGNKRPLVETPASDERTPAFSPDGRQVVFFSNRDGQRWSLYRVDVATGAIERLTHGAAQDKHPQVTPDGHEIVFHSDRGRAVTFDSGPGAPPERSMRIFALDLRGGAPRQLSDSAEPRDDRHPFVSPDGRTIVFHGNRLKERKGKHEKDGRDLFIMTRDGAHTINLTDEDSRTFKHPSWSADGTKILFVFKRKNRAYNLGVLDVRAALARLEAAR